MSFRWFISAVFTSILCISTAAAQEMCSQDDYNVVSSLARQNGYTWAGGRSECVVRFYPTSTFYRDARNVSSGSRDGLNATLLTNPLRIQFSNGIVTSYVFCAVLQNGYWVSTGQRACPR